MSVADEANVTSTSSAGETNVTNPSFEDISRRASPRSIVLRGTDEAIDIALRVRDPELSELLRRTIVSLQSFFLYFARRSSILGRCCVAIYSLKINELTACMPPSQSHYTRVCTSTRSSREVSERR